MTTKNFLSSGFFFYLRGLAHANKYLITEDQNDKKNTELVLCKFSIL